MSKEQKVLDDLAELEESVKTKPELLDDKSENDKKVLEGLHELEEMIEKEPIQQDDQTEKPEDYDEIKNVFFAFIDVLGFSKTFSTDKKNAAIDYNEIFKYYFYLMKVARMENRGSVSCAGQTSDSLYFYTDRSDMMIRFMKIYSHFSLFAMSKNVFFRGGIATGCLYKKESYQFFGDSVIKAYTLESQISKYPIILIDKKASKELIEHDEFDDLTTLDDDGRRYLKPFVAWKTDLLESGNFECEKIDYETIYNNIQKNISLFEYDEKNYHKYLYLNNQLQKCRKEELENVGC